MMIVSRLIFMIMSISAVASIIMHQKLGTSNTLKRAHQGAKLELEQGQS